MAVPFSADTWHLTSANPCPTLVGAGFTFVTGIAGAGHYAPTRTLQVFSNPATSFTNRFNTAFISFNDGKTWTMTWDGRIIGQDGTMISSPDEQDHVISAWSLDVPGLGQINYQIRVHYQFDFFVGNGTLYAGGIKLYASQGESAFFQFVQDLYSWQQQNFTTDGGGQAFFQNGPSFTTPILIEGSGPNGEDAFWMASQFNLEYGALGNRQVISANDLWRSVDGVEWGIAGPGPGGINYSSMFESPSGRVFVVAQGISYTDSDDLPTASWLSSSFDGQTVLGPAIVPMYGGTLVSTRNGSLSSAGAVILSCDNGVNFFTGAGLVPVNRVGMIVKLGPTECLLIAQSLTAPTTDTKAYYSSDGGETWLDGGVWNVTSVGERPVAGFLRGDGHPLVVTSSNIFFSSDNARGVAGTRTMCPLANAGLAEARKLLLCGGVITPDCQES